MNLKFQRSLFSRYDFSQWLEYSVSKDAAFWFVCQYFGSLVGSKDKQFSEDGFQAWRKASDETGTFIEHLKS